MLHLYACGFNGFGQILPLEHRDSISYYVTPKFIYRAKSNETVDVCICWSSIYLVIKNHEETFLKCDSLEPKPVKDLEKIAISNQYVLSSHTNGLKFNSFDKGEGTKIVEDKQSDFHNAVFESHSICEETIGISNTKGDPLNQTTDQKGQFPYLMNKSEESPDLSCNKFGVTTCKIKKLFAQENVFYSLYADGSLSTIEVSPDAKGLRLNHTPIPLPIKLTIKQVSCGKEHVILLSESNQIFTLGLGSRGQLGHGDVEERKDPQEVDALSGISIKSVTAGGWHSTAVSEDGDLYSWGWNESGQLGLPCPLLSVDPNSETHGLVTLPTVIDLPAPVHKVSCGSRHTTILLEDNVLMASGWNKYGQLGTGDTASHDQFTKLDISVATDRIVIDIVAGSWNTIVISSS